MIKQIVKRDGRKVPFELEKITNAIFKAAQAIGGSNYNEAEELAKKVCDYIENVEKIETPTVEHVQDTVEKMMIENGHARTAKEFILYRAERTKHREMNTQLMKIYEDLTFKSAKDNDVKRENANIDGDTAMGTMLQKSGLQPGASPELLSITNTELIESIHRAYKKKIKTK